MSFFNFRRASTSPPTVQSVAPENAETLRRRAKHRLIGSAVLVLIAVVGFPLVFDTQPRPMAVDIPIEIPSKATAKPLILEPSAAAAIIAPAAVSPQPAAAGRASDGKVATAASLTPEEEILTPEPAPRPPAGKLPATVKTETKPPVKALAKPDVKPLPKPEAKTSPANDAARAQALLNGGNAALLLTPAVGSEVVDTGARIVVQAGAFADAAKAREVRSKLDSVGLKTYTQVAQTADGQRTRVRAGPFASRAEADKAAAKIKALGLSASILSL